MIRSVQVVLGERSYPITIGRHPGEDAWGPAWSGRRALVISDANVAAPHGDRVAAALDGLGADVFRATVAAGEASKSLAGLAMLYDEAVRAGLDRQAVVVALGGGMVGDLAGFLAATYLRGVGLIQAPTSLLAMVDSSVGGKTGINLAAGKNLAGAFHQPERVVADLACLDTLPSREYVSGLAEVVKYGIIWDAAFFEDLENGVAPMLARADDRVAAIVARCCEIKADVVGVDERETGVRAILNFGHTLGHAIETVTGYGRWLHGEAVAAGMDYAARLSAAVRGLDSAVAGRVARLLTRLGLPTLRHPDIRTLDWAALRQAMARDKKSRRDRPRWVLAERLGGAVFGVEVDDALAERVFSDSVEEHGDG